MKYFLCYMILCLLVYKVTSKDEDDDDDDYENDDSEDNDYEDKNITACLTPGREAGYCVSLLSCPHMVKAIATYKMGPINYFLNSKCGNFKVCCGVRTIHDPTRFVFGDEPFTVQDHDFEISKKLNQTMMKNREFVMQNILPSTTYCGYQHTDDRFYNDFETAIDELPWLVNFVATFAISKGPPKRDDFYHLCAGALITNQHVLSSSYCSFKRFNINAVRLGQHNLRKNNTCVKDSIDTECSRFIEIPVAEHVRVGDSNFMLYKLQKRVVYDDYVRPICLTLKDENRPGVNGTLITSGWSDNKKENINKKRIISKILDNKYCNEGLNDSIRYGKVNPKYAVCALKKQNSNSEVEDSDKGSPFTYAHKHQWFLDGIVNYVKDDYLIGEKLTADIRNWILDGLFYFHEKK